MQTMARVSCQTNPNKECGRERVGHVIQERAIKGSIITGEAIMHELHPRKPRVPESERTREVLVPVL